MSEEVQRDPISHSKFTYADEDELCRLVSEGMFRQEAMRKLGKHPTLLRSLLGRRPHFNERLKAALVIGRPLQRKRMPPTRALDIDPLKQSARSSGPRQIKKQSLVDRFNRLSESAKKSLEESYPAQGPTQSLPGSPFGPVEMKEFFMAMRFGATPYRAAAAIGVDKSVIDRELERNPIFRAKCEEVFAKVAAHHERKVFQAKDWQASMKWLEKRVPEYGPPEQKTDSKITINIEYSNRPPLIECENTFSSSQVLTPASESALPRLEGSTSFNADDDGEKVSTPSDSSSSAPPEETP